MTSKRFLESKKATILFSIALIFVMVFAAKILYQKYQIDREIANLQKQADKIKQDNNQLSYLIQYFSTEQYQEKEAREKLNLQKEGEHVVVLPNGSNMDESNAQINQNQSNIKKWFDYFFKAD